MSIAALFVNCGGATGSTGGGSPAPLPGNGGGGASSPEYLFGSDNTNHVIGAWQINTATGALTPIPGSPFPAVGGENLGIAVHPNDKVLYTANYPSNIGSVFDPGGITAYSIAGNGALTPIGAEVPDNQNGGASLRPAVDASGIHVYVASDLSIGASAFTISSSGAVTPLNPGGFDFQNHHGTSDIVVINRFVYLTSAVGIDGQDINSDGSLTPATIGVGQTNINMDRLVVSGGKFLYATTLVVPPPGDPFHQPEPGHIYGWIINGDGSLTQIASTPALLAGVSGIATSGKFLFASSPTGMTVLTVDQNSGALSQIAGSPFSGGSNLHDLNVDHSGSFLYGASGSQISALAIGSGGALTPVPGSPFSSGGIVPFALAATK